MLANSLRNTRVRNDITQIKMVRDKLVKLVKSAKEIAQEFKIIMELSIIWKNRLLTLHRKINN